MNFFGKDKYCTVGIHIKKLILVCENNVILYDYPDYNQMIKDINLYIEKDVTDRVIEYLELNSDKFRKMIKRNKKQINNQLSLF